MRSLVTFRYHFLSKEWKDSGFVNQTHLSELSLYENAEAIHPQLVFGRGHGRLTARGPRIPDSKPVGEVAQGALGAGAP